MIDLEKYSQATFDAEQDMIDSVTKPEELEVAINKAATELAQELGSIEILARVGALMQWAVDHAGEIFGDDVREAAAEKIHARGREVLRVKVTRSSSAKHQKRARVLLAQEGYVLNDDGELVKDDEAASEVMFNSLFDMLGGSDEDENPFEGPTQVAA